MAQVVPLRYDTAFKKTFGQPEIFCQFAEDVLGIKFHTDARALISEGISTEVITRTTGLTEAEIEKLRQS